MNRFLLSLTAIFLFTAALSAQTEKGIDTQTTKIKENTNKTTQTQTNNSGGRSWTWGPDKTKVRDRLENPIRLNSRRDVLVQSVMDVLQEKKIIVDEAASRPKDGLIVTQPFIFAKGAVITKNELSRYAVLPDSETSWTRGRYTLTIEIQSIDGIQNNVSVTAKVEGRSENGLLSEWTTLQSSGSAEEEILTKLVEAVTGNSPDDVKPDNR
ncbi:MAG: hypothetical protein JSS81_25845 [Acidobacteria bacterium]|nr:hypothetical protein [Acidobacteriota bacterium]